MKKMLIVVNPKAGKCNGAKSLSRILQIFQSAGYLPTVVQTEKSGDARRLTSELAHLYNIIVCIGGDGTFSELVSGIVNTQCDIQIGYIPTGSTNDYAASLGLSRDIGQAAVDIVNGKSRWFDIGLFNAQPFVYVASFGDFARMSYSAPQDLKNIFGHLAYILEGVCDLHNIRTYHARLETDDVLLEGDYLFGTVSNSTSIGGILRLDANDVSLDDGYLEILLIKRPANPKELAQLIQAFSSKSFVGSNCISFLRSQRLKIWTETETPWTLDGECTPNEGCAEIYTLPKAVQILLS